MQRVREPELMDTPAEALAYDQMDHSEVNRRFVDDLLQATGPLPSSASIVDLGTGTALIPIELCRRNADYRVVAIDAAVNMLEVACTNIGRASLDRQITLVHHDAKRILTELGRFDVVMSNSLIHHLPEPAIFFQVAAAMVAPGGHLFVRDLFRPETESEVQHLVVTYAADAAPEQQQLLAESLRAALTLTEVRQLVAEQGFAVETVQATSDRHWTWSAHSGGAHSQKELV